ncbi:MAG: family 16 glycoside hydrolase [Candidatus Promineifilaceae bacterium]
MRHKRLIIGLLFLVFGGLTACRSGSDSASLGGEDALFSDAFSPDSTGPWLLEGDDVGRTAVINQELIIAIDQPNTFQFTTLSEPLFTDFILEVEVRQLAGTPESSFGVLARMQNNDQFYRFDIMGSGLYMVQWRNANGSWSQSLPDWAASEAINQGLNVPNRLKVVAQGSNLSFYVNDVLLQQIDDVLFPSGAIGLAAGTFGQPGLQVAFDNVVVREP